MLYSIHTVDSWHSYPGNDLRELSSHFIFQHPFVETKIYIYSEISGLSYRLWYNSPQLRNPITNIHTFRYQMDRISTQFI